MSAVLQPKGRAVVASSAFVLVALAGCLAEDDVFPAKCGSGEVPYPRVGDRYWYNVTELHVPVYAGIRDGGMPTPLMHGQLPGVAQWPATHRLEIAFGEPKGLGHFFQGELLPVSYFATNATTRAVLLQELLDSSLSVRASITLEVVDDKEFVYIRTDQPGLPAVMGAGLAWGKNLTSERLDNVSLPGPFLMPAHGQMLSSTPEWVLGWPTWETTFHVTPRILRASHEPYCNNDLLLAPRGHLYYAPYPTHSYRAGEPGPLPDEVDYGRMGLAGSEPGAGTLLDAWRAPTLPPPMPREQSLEAALAGNPFGFDTSLAEAVSAAEQDASTGPWLADRPHAVVTAVRHLDLSSGGQDRWDLQYVAGSSELHVVVTRQSPQQADPALPLPIFPEEPEFLVEAHDDHGHAIHTSGRTLTNIQHMAAFQDAFAPDMDVQFLACDAAWRVCWIASQHGPGWEIDVEPRLGRGEPMTNPGRLAGMGVAFHMDFPYAVQARIPASDVRWVGLEP